ncbi:hypothetical protein [Secundilactobacillus muriivasis]
MGKSKRVMIAMLAGSTVGMGGFGLHSILSDGSNVAFAAVSSTFNSDYKAVMASVKQSSPAVQLSYGTYELGVIKIHPEEAYEKNGFNISNLPKQQAYYVLYGDANGLSNENPVNVSEYDHDWAGLTTLYDHFKTRFSKAEQNKLSGCQWRCKNVGLWRLENVGFRRSIGTLQTV